MLMITRTPDILGERCCMYEG